MKVERKTVNVFQPIVITLETREEAVLLKSILGETGKGSNAKLIGKPTTHPSVEAMSEMYRLLDDELSDF